MGIEAENELERHLILRQECGFGLTRHELRALAFNFMKKLGVTHRLCDLLFYFSDRR
jgi:ubiquinone biosynthesis protein COQ9